MTSLLQVKTVVRCASCDLQRAAGINVVRGHADKRHCANRLSGGGETRGLAARARRAAKAVIDLRIVKACCTVVGPLSSGVRPWCDVRAVISNAQPAFTWHADKRHCADVLL